ncbi:MAG: hypothetical protein A2122_00265 [Candidatus Liptonbacteria bacterium GWB1_49_6]|uniref:Uncharacterized protein n=1 Tax=Candidatus Liptonbacteria bacterium GWB1_49_6 TaxID=1798644 RepID=A0A1G2C799_9BACT|nr:MAG: hypothetical protein A2122_00265 [Candidatus Liptonbacteria bacterium GWB1_49_6]
MAITPKEATMAKAKKCEKVDAGWAGKHKQEVYCSFLTGEQAKKYLRETGPMEYDNMDVFGVESNDIDKVIAGGASALKDIAGVMVDGHPTGPLENVATVAGTGALLGALHVAKELGCTKVFSCIRTNDGDCSVEARNHDDSIIVLAHNVLFFGT